MVRPLGLIESRFEVTSEEKRMKKERKTRKRKRRKKKEKKRQREEDVQVIGFLERDPQRLWSRP